MSKIRKKIRKKKLTSIPIIIKRLFRLASIRCRERANNKCEICGMCKGDKHPNTGKPQKVEAHHIMNRKNKNSPLKFDLRNLICLCGTCHKFGRFSAHGHGIWFGEWLRINKPKQHAWILKHSNDVVDLTDRTVLQKIEDQLKSKDALKFD